MNETEVITRIKQLCEEKNWSYYRLAKESGLTYSTLSTLLNKPNIPTIATILKICGGLGITLSQFFSESKNPIDLTAEQKECLNLFNSLNKNEQALALAYLKGISSKAK